MDKKTIAYRLTFTSPLHIGNERDDYAKGSANIHSDTLYAAIWWAYSYLGKTNHIPTEKNPNELNFVLSSAFPFIKVKENTFSYFFPRPQHTKSMKYEKIETEDTKLRKKVKKISWVDKDILELFLNEKAPIYSEEKIKNQFCSIHQIDNINFVDSTVVPRAKVSRFGEEDTTIFYTERFYFPENTGLYFLVQFENQEEEKLFEAALRILGEEGIGTDRNIGNGKFTWEKDAKFVFPIVSKKKNLGMSLGMYCPSSKEELEKGLKESEEIGYELSKRGGWLSEPYNSWRKKSVFMLKEGSTLCTENQENTIHILGKNVDIKPNVDDYIQVNHPIWRCGRTLFLNF